MAVATSFRWRHRFLRAGVADAEALSGIVEADETFFRRSFKGSRCWRKQADPPPRPPKRRATPARKRGLSDEQVPVLVTRDRTGSTRAAVLADRSADAIDVAIGASLPADGVLCTDSHAAFRLVADRHAIHHEPVNSRLKSWIAAFNGVATRYLPNYLAWHHVLDKKPDVPDHREWLRLTINS
ncbi:MAG: IS1595 family transposase [Geminicoccaceae bacterium]|nr:IS1595 family transposase [Geminicoccaceae bacterium]